jgi:hypothetical protein
MEVTNLLIIIRILAYAAMALYALDNRRWWVWGAFTALCLTTFIYGFTGVSAVVVELLRTIVAMILIYISLRRK